MDWSALATFFTGLVALLIYFNWRNQKSSEVIAIEAKDLLNKINSLQSKLKFVDYNTAKFLILDLDYKDSFLLIQELITTLDFLDDKIPDIESYKKPIHSFLEHWKHLKNLADNDKSSLGGYSEESQKQIKDFSQALSNLKKPIRKLARYEK